MSSNKSVQKRIRTSNKANLYNKHYKSLMRTVIKKVMGATSTDEATPLVKTAISTIDKIAGKGVIHKNNAGNQKSRIMKYLNSL
ncbi:MAG: 30S ribosomal protein S20 [Candidatus Marinimicrobia bacterium]|nr:30S ribosomal protein S20 [Candidatus Neomarinimicrobiota bacterium]